MALTVAGRQPEARVIGIDIADQAISRNQNVAKDQARANIEFHLSDGRTFDFPDTALEEWTNKPRRLA